MLDFLRLPKGVNDNTSKEELLEYFWGYAYIFSVTRKDNADSRQAVLDMIEDIPYTPQTCWNALWFASLIESLPVSGIDCIKAQMVLELDYIAEMPEQEFESMFRLYFSVLEEGLILNPIAMAPRIVHQLNPEVRYVWPSDRCKASVAEIVNKNWKEFDPVVTELRDNPHFSRKRMVQDIVDSVICSDFYLTKDYKEFLLNALRLICGWGEKPTQKQIDILISLNSCVTHAAQARLQMEVQRAGGGKKESKEKKGGKR